MVSLLLAAVFSSYAAYRADKKRTEKTLELLLSSKVLIVGHALGLDDDKLLRLTISAIVAIPNVEYVSFKPLEHSKKLSVGTRPENGATATRIVHKISNGRAVRVGTLTIGISFKPAEVALYDRLRGSLLAALGAILAMWVGIALIFHRVIGLPLGQLREAILGWKAGQHVAISHSVGDDEIGSVLRSFNELQEERLSYENALREIRAELETRVSERTLELTEARDRAEHANRARSDFLAAVSHEIRTPMNAILGIAQSLSTALQDAEHRDQIRTLLESGRVLTVLLDDILDQAKIDADRMTIAPVRSSLRQLVETATALWRPLSEAKGITLGVAIDDSVPQWLRFDPVRVRQCLVNLLSNANKFTEHGGISISAVAEPTEDGRTLVSVSVADTGPGIAEHVLPRLFEPFSQADNTTTRRFGGSGLGLAICKSLSNLMGGDISVETRFGEGSTFTFTFTAEPLSAETVLDTGPINASADTPGHELDLHGKRVLVIDDVATNRFIVHLLLSSTGAVVDEADNGPSALAQLAETAYDLVLLDIHMPQMDGFDTLTRMRKLDTPSAAAPVIAFTADVEEANHQRLMSAGIDGFLAKPIDFRAALTEIRRALERNGGGDN